MSLSDEAREASRDKATQHRARGLCPDCGEPRGDKSRCEKHLAIHAKRARMRRKKAAAAKAREARRVERVRAKDAAEEAAKLARIEHRRAWYREWQRKRRAEQGGSHGRAA